MPESELMERFATKIMTVLDLCRPMVSISITLSAIAGFIISSRAEASGIVTMAAGMLFLAGGCSALNQYQERDIDGRMERTRGRPIPSGRMSPARALVFSVMLIFGGVLGISLSGGMPAVLLGLSGVAAYNGMYTFLKKKTPFAVVPGALVGSIPPAIGWVSAGGAILNFRLAVLCFFFFMWQIPHFWLLLMKYGDEYEGAGLPSLRSIFSGDQSRRIVFHWMIAAAISCQLISLFGVKSHLIGACLLVVALFCVVNAVGLLRRGEVSFQSAFGRLNSYMFIVLFLVMIDGIAAILDSQVPGFLEWI